MSWQERLREIDEIRRRQERKAVKKRGQDEDWQNEQARRQAREEAEHQKIIQELPQILERFRARQLLEDVRSKVWKNQGDIVYFSGQKNLQRILDGYVNVPDHTLGYVLYFKYQSGSSLGSKLYDRQFDSTIYEKVIGHIINSSTHLLIGVHANDFSNRAVIFVETHFNGGLNPVEGANKFTDLKLESRADIDVNDPSAQEKLEEVLMRDCIHRTQKHTLPEDLRAFGERTIQEEVPWFMRLFRF